MNIGTPKISDHREVNVTLTETDLVTVPAPSPHSRETTFRPAKLTIKYANSRLADVYLSGLRLRADGTPYATGEHGRLYYVARGDGGYELSSDASQWIADLVTQCTPPASA